MVADVGRKQVLVQLDDTQVDVLDRIGEALDESRSELIRRAIDLYLEAVREEVADARYAEAYRRIPEDVGASTELLAAGLAAWPT
jgi:metal-responsive CopG/Arc/MetJ family transcriptional regulator